MNTHFRNHDHFNMKSTVIPLLFTLCIFISMLYDNLYFGIVVAMLGSLLYAYQDGHE